MKIEVEELGKMKIVGGGTGTRQEQPENRVKMHAYMCENVIRKPIMYEQRMNIMGWQDGLVCKGAYCQTR